jgi:FkbM family methyltransferase
MSSEIRTPIQTAHLPHLADRLVPPILRSLWRKLHSHETQRQIFESTNGVRAYVHPHSHLGLSLLSTGRYEIDTEDLIAQNIGSGDVFVDIGANEGFLSAFAAKLLGPTGVVIAVEPQSRLLPLIEINLRLNEAKRFHIVHRAVGDDSNASGLINLYPETNTGQTSLLKRPRLGWTTLRQEQERIRFITPSDILAECAVDHFDFVKVDVEGYEGTVVDGLLPLIRTGKVSKLLLDYHASILRKSGIDADSIHRKLLDAGMKVAVGDGRHLDSYLLYVRPAAV